MPKRARSRRAKLRQRRDSSCSLPSRCDRQAHHQQHRPPLRHQTLDALEALACPKRRRSSPADGRCRAPAPRPPRRCAARRSRTPAPYRVRRESRRAGRLRCGSDQGLGSRAQRVALTHARHRPTGVPDRRPADPWRPRTGRSAGRLKMTSRSAPHGQPGVLAQFLLELARRPSGVAERDQDLIGPVALADRLQDVARSRQADARVDRQRRLPVAGRPMQHETAIDLHRPAEVHRQLAARVVVAAESRSARTAP